MITSKNYFEVAKNINFSTLPEALQKGHAMAEKASKSGTDWSMYEKSDAIRKTMDLYFEKLTPFVAKPAKKTVAKKRKLAVKYRTNPSIPEETLKKAEKAVRAVKAARAKKAKAPVALHDHFTEEETVIKAFINMNGKVKTDIQIKSLLDRTNKYIVERKIRKNSPNAEAILTVQNRLTKALRALESGGGHKLELDFTERTLELLRKFTKQSKVFTTVQLLKRIIPLSRTKPDKEKVKKLLADIGRGLKSGSIQETDTYYEILSEATIDLEAYLKGKYTGFLLENPSLSGLGSLPEFAGLACPGKDDCGCPDEKKTVSQTLSEVSENPVSELSGVAKKPKAARRAAGKKPRRR